MISGPPQTNRSLKEDFLALGLNSNMTLMVHSSLSSIGWVVGGACTVVDALLNVVSDKGTLVMPAATPQCEDPAVWKDVVIPDKWLAEVRDNLPVFDPEITPTQMGAIAECFRTWPGSLRSNHPIGSVCARGPLAQKITAEHPMTFCEGAGTPFEKLYDLDSWVLLLGVGFNRCTMLHYAESRSEKRRTQKNRFPIMENGQRIWKEVDDMANDNGRLFPTVGAEFMATGAVKKGSIGEAESMLFQARDLVHFAEDRFNKIL
ncbi:AAC(3) family N-acetyltransferase [Fulvivirgaceae bacterium BMA10]|uniref:Aminoglycoside N(3)-acetyltransferase n=1 Tax=Splendidivirga corallicola TaxID=3051826 RepID=A0ABT8KJI6_9BACT|nr:AAC(3) family N-acetyltransferase [Fulvivirgaceae bacterium BMA10]